jgi:hypothetical protein
MLDVIVLIVIEPLMATRITEAKIVLMDDHSCLCPCCIAIQFEQCPFHQITNQSTHTIDSYNREKGFRRTEMAKLPLDYHWKFLDYYRKGGKPTIQKDVVIICYRLKTLPLLADEELPTYPLDFAIMISIVTSDLLERMVLKFPTKIVW